MLFHDGSPTPSDLKSVSCRRPTAALGARTQPATHAHARSSSRHSGKSVRSAQPRLIEGRPRQAGLLARGLESCIAFPNLVIQWPIDAGAPLTVAGAARALNPSSL